MTESQFQIIATLSAKETEQVKAKRMYGSRASKYDPIINSAMALEAGQSIVINTESEEACKLVRQSIMSMVARKNLGEIKTRAVAGAPTQFMVIRTNK